MLEGGVHNLLGMPLFSSVDVDGIQHHTAAPPFIPRAIELDRLSQGTPILWETLAEWDGAVSALALS